MNLMRHAPPRVASPPQNPCLQGPWMSSLSGKHLGTVTHFTDNTQGGGGAQHACPSFSEYHLCTQTGKRHGQSSGMRHGWRSSWSGVRTPVRPSVQGPVGEAPATAPFSIPLHHRYRRCDGWRVSSIFPNPPTPRRSDPHTKTKHQAQHTCSSALRHCYRRPPGGACPPHIPLPLARGRGLEPGSSGRGSAAQPLHHAAQNPAKVWFPYPFLPASPSMNVSLVCLR